MTLCAHCVIAPADRAWRRLGAADRRLFTRLTSRPAPRLDAAMYPLSSRRITGSSGSQAQRSSRLTDGAVGAPRCAGCSHWWLTSALSNAMLKPIFRRARPTLIRASKLDRIARVPGSTSFPSGHAASAFAFAAAAGMEAPMAIAPLGALASAVAYSRVRTRVHYPGDVIAGAAIGVTVAFATRKIWSVPPNQPAQAPPSRATADACRGHRRPRRRGRRQPRRRLVRRTSGRRVACATSGRAADPDDRRHRSGRRLGICEERRRRGNRRRGRLDQCRGRKGAGNAASSRGVSRRDTEPLRPRHRTRRCADDDSCDSRWGARGGRCRHHRRKAVLEHGELRKLRRPRRCARTVGAETRQVGGPRRCGHTLGATRPADRGRDRRPGTQRLDDLHRQLRVPTPGPGTRVARTAR